VVTKNLKTQDSKGKENPHPYLFTQQSLLLADFRFKFGGISIFRREVQNASKAKREVQMQTLDFQIDEG